MKKRFKNNFISLFLLLFIFLFVFVFINESFARAGGGFGGGFGGGGGGGGRGRAETYILDFFIYIGDHYGLQNALLVFLPLILLHFICTICFCYYSYEKVYNRFLCTIGYLIFGYLMYFSLCITLFLLPTEIIFLLSFINNRIKYGRFLTSREEAKIHFEERYKLDEQKVLVKIQKENPSFSYEIFKERIINAFRIIQDSWMYQDLSKAQNFLADGTYEQFQIQINGMITAKTVDVMTDLEIMNVFPIKAETSSDYDSIYVAIQAKAINYLENKETKLVIKGSTDEAEIFEEIWCFMRRKGAKELDSKGLIEGYCPNCGTRIQGSRLINCPSCDALLKSGQHDWILAGIYQSSGWRDTHNESIPGLNALYDSDPSFNIQNIEDKLAAYFWRMIEAVRTKKATPILKISTDSFSQQLINSFYKHKEISTTYMAGTDSISVLCICKENDKHILLGEIEWNSCPNNDLEHTIHKKSVFILQRDVKAKTDVSKCFCSMHCNNCGALENLDNLNYCNYCDTVSNNDKKDWILTNIISGDDNLVDSYKRSSYAFDLEITSKHINDKLKKNLVIDQKDDPNIDQNVDQIKDQLSEPQKLIEQKTNDSVPEEDDSEFNNMNLFGKYSIKNTLRMCIAVMLADGKIDENEMKIIRKICEKGFISEVDLQKYIKEIQSNDNPMDYVLKTAAIQLDKDLFKLLIRIAASDGNIDKSESDFINRIADKMYFSKDEVTNLINKYSNKNKWYQLL